MLFSSEIKRYKMKLFKKITLALITCATAFSCACTSSGTVVSTLFGGSFWLSSTEVSEVAQVNETCVYDFSLIDLRDGLTADLTDESKLVTTLTNVTEGDTQYYKFTTELTVKGSYSYGGKVIPVDDKVTSECLFAGINKQFRPYKSTKSATIVSPYGLDGISFTYTAYTITTEYDGSTAHAIVTPGEKISEELKALGVTENLPDATDKKYEKLKSPFIDNEITLFFPRAANLTAGFSATYYTLDVLSQKNHTMKLSVDSEKGSSEIKVPAYSYNNMTATETSFACFNASVSISDFFSGTPINLYYAAAGSKNENRRRLIKTESVMPYSVGTQILLLSSVTVA